VRSSGYEMDEASSHHLWAYAIYKQFGDRQVRDHSTGGHCHGRNPR